MLSKKRKLTAAVTATATAPAAMTAVPDEVPSEPKKFKAAEPTLPNGDHPSPQEPIVDCRQMPFKGINVKT